MTLRLNGGNGSWQRWCNVAAAVVSLFILSACAVTSSPTPDNDRTLRQTATLVQEVKAFGKTLGIEATEALSRTAEERPAISILWLWLQREGTLAVRAPIDIWLAIGFSSDKGRVPLEQVYRVDGYSVYYRQGNEFADERSVATVGFAAEGSVRRVMIILHEDLHGDMNFNLRWEIEESIVTPLGSLAAVEFFRQKEDHENLDRALEAVELQRKYSRELNELKSQAVGILQRETPAEAKKKILELIPSYPTYNRYFQRQIAGQHPPTVLEAKLSHDLAYFQRFDQIASLAEKVGDLKILISDLKKLSHDTRHDDLERYLQRLDSDYSTPTK
jgi:hypothetical protein